MGLDLFICIILFTGCTSIPSKFVENDDYGYVSKCGFYIHESIDRKNLYLLKDDSRRIYIFILMDGSSLIIGYKGRRINRQNLNIPL